MNELCPMCHKHPAILMHETVRTIFKERVIEYEEAFYFCSFLGEDDPDAYFFTGKLLNQNLENARRAYDEKNE